MHLPVPPTILRACVMARWGVARRDRCWAAGEPLANTVLYLMQQFGDAVS
jgi:hypothetical protein